MTLSRLLFPALLATLVLAPGTAEAGDGTFTQAPNTPIAAGVSPTSISIGDFNNDGRQDLAITDNGPQKLVILLGAGDGTFSQPQGSPFNATSNPSGSVVGFFNADSDEDVAIAAADDPGIVEVQQGVGNGTFNNRAGTGTDAANNGDMAIGDLNSDSSSDLAVLAPADGGVAVLLGYTDGYFTIPAGSPFPMGRYIGSVAIGDFNSDGHEDIATVESYPLGGVHKLWVVYGAGDGRFSAAAATATRITNPDELVVGDFNGDGSDDAVTVSSTSPGDASVMLGDGAGHFNEPEGSSFTLGNSPRGLVAGDFNSDGHEDVATAVSGPPGVSVALGAGDGTFTKAAGSPFPVANRARDLEVGDVNSDGNEDIVTVSGEGTATVLLGGGPPADVGNLLVNGGGEGPGRGASAPHDYTVIAPPPGWTTTNGFSYLRYGVIIFPRRLLSARWGGQEAFFTSGLQNTSSPSTASQTVSVADKAGAIDAGRASVRLSGYLGGYRTANESIAATATFLDANGQAVGTALTIGPVGVAERKMKTTFLRRSGTAPVPVGTRSIAVTLTATHISGIYFDAAYADRMALFMSTDPDVPPGGGSPPPGTPPPGSGGGAGADKKPPQTKITARPRNRVRAAKVSYRFKASEKGSTFKCRFDRQKRFKRCRSPLLMKHLKRGKHRFAVRATDKAGNTDKTPATDTFKRRR